MAQIKLGSAGVTVREIDVSGQTKTEPTGIPAGVIGTANKGPAFVPVTMGNISDFYATFGRTDGKKFGPLAVVEWLRNAGSATYVRVLGVGDGKRRATTGNTAGAVTSAGFTVGEKLPDESTGLLVNNPYANAGGVTGRTFLLGCFMSESAGADIFSAAALQGTGSTTPNAATAIPIVRAIMMTPSGVIARLSSSYLPSAAPASTYVAVNTTTSGGMLGDVVLLESNKAKQEFVLLLNGHKGTDTAYPNAITASFDMTAPNYFGNVLNKDPLKIQKAGHYLYAAYDIHPALAVVTGTNIVVSGSGAAVIARAGTEPSAFLVTGSAARDVGTSTIPNYENFNDRYRHATTPWIVSQKFGGTAVNLFKLHSLDDGAGISQAIKFSIENIAPSSDPANKYGTFDLLVRSIDDRDDEKVILEAWRGLSLDPRSERYIAKVIGDLNVYFEFDRVETAQKLVVDGNYPNRSSYIRVEIAPSVENEEVDAIALPMGFRGIAHLVTSGSAPMAISASVQLSDASVFKKIVQPPLPMRKTIANKDGILKEANSALYWGTHFEHANASATPNESIEVNRTVSSLAKYLPDFMTAVAPMAIFDNPGAADTAENGIVDADKFNKNFFSLENVMVVTTSVGRADTSRWKDAVYVRRGDITTNDVGKQRAFRADDLNLIANRKYAKFSFIMQGGFNGVNIFDSNEADITNTAVTQDMDDTNRGLNLGPSVKSYAKAIQIMENTTDVDIQLLAIPGIRNSVITDQAANSVKDRFDAMYIMDIEEFDNLNGEVTGSAQVPHVGNTVTQFLNRAIDNSFAAAYYPDVIMTDPNTNTNLVVPASVAVLGAFAQNDRLAHPWFAPAGFARGALTTTLQAKVQLYKENMDALYEADINPITAFPGSGQGVVVWGQKTLQAAASALDRVNVRRLLIQIRREIKEVSNTIIFEPNRETTLQRFSAACQPRLQRIQSQNGVEKYLVQIDASTTSQLDVEQGVIRGKIFVQPTKTIEFVSIDFVVTNRGTTGV